MDHIEPFAEFIARTANARPEQYATAIRAAAERHGLLPERVTDEFERMKKYISSYYEGVAPVDSFRDAAGQVVDCVPFEQQPSVRAARAAGYPTDLTPPPPVGIQGVTRPRDAEPLSAPVSGQSLPPGIARPLTSAPASSSAHAACAAPGTVPLVRITLERLISLGTLDNFFRKGPAPQAAENGSSPGG